jgi:CheY-like chemotaxis protein
MMPEVNGFMVVDKLRETPRTSDIPIIILTAKIVSAEERRRLNGHIVAIAEKSGINRATFLSEVNRAVRTHVAA